MDLKPVAAGMFSYIPGANRVLNPVIYKNYFDHRDPKKIARFHYSDWLRHLVAAHRNGAFDGGLPRAVAELGPGNSLGTGLCALLSGAEKYYAFDVVQYASSKADVAVLDELVRLFKRQADIPADNDEWPSYCSEIESYSFPSHILTQERLCDGTCDERVAHIRELLLSLHESSRSDQMISYFAPYDGLEVKPGSVDMVLGRRIMEHVDDLDTMYKQMSYWLRMGGLVSMSGDLGSHGFAKKWNGHWAYSDFLWKIVRGKHPWFINREPCSTHLELLNKYGFTIIGKRIWIKSVADGIARESLSSRFRNLSEDDFLTSLAFVQAVKRY